MTEPPAITSGEPAISFGPFRLVAAQRLLTRGRQAGAARQSRLRHPDHSGRARRRGSRQGGADRPSLASNVRGRSESEDPGQRIAPRARRWTRRQSLRGDDYGARVQFRRSNTPRGGGAGAASAESGGGGPQPAVRSYANDRPRGNRGHARRTTVAPTPSDDRRSGRHRRKTTVALAVAERGIASYEHGVWLVDLAPLVDPRLVASAVATVLGLEVRTEDPLSGLVAALRDDHMLLLDNCEHVIDATANLAAAVLKGTSGVRILATSREPLRIAGGTPVPPRTAWQP
jgi:hypothetical protein